MGSMVKIGPITSGDRQHWPAAEDSQDGADSPASCPLPPKDKLHQSKQGESQIPIP